MYDVQANNDLQTSDFNGKIDVLNNDYKILAEFDNIFCAGDSLTWGAVYTGSGNADFRAAKKPYNQVLQTLTGVTTARNAQPGIDAKNYVSKLSSIVEKPNQLVIIYLGTNGGLTDTLNTDAPGMNKEDYDLTTETGSYAYIVKHCLDVNAKVLLVKIYAGGGSNGVALTNTVIGKVAEKFGVAVIENNSLPQKYHIWPNGQGYDYTHLNDFGYAAFAEYLIRQVNAMDAAMLARILPDA
jgi:lysophospholipase L1-like esterase